MKYLFAIVFCLFSILQSHAQSISKIIVYKRFASAGTTVGLWHTFHHPGDYASTVDTTNINMPLVLSPADFQQLLATAKKHKLTPTQVGGVRFAGSMAVDRDQHFYVYCKPGLLIDLTAKLVYELEAVPAGNFDEKAAQLTFQE